MAACPRCGDDNPRRARFCMACGAPLGAAAGIHEVRKTVTAVCCGVSDADSIGASLDPESFDALMRIFRRWVSSFLAEHGASIASAAPLEVSAVFGIPTSREDDALRAVRAVAELHSGLPDLNLEAQLRGGASVKLASALVTAEVLTVEGDPAAPSGGAVAAARQLQRLANPGEILLDGTTQQLVGPAVRAELLPPLEPSGRAPVRECWRLGAVTADEIPRRHDVPLVDRTAELDLLRRLCAQVTAARSCHLVTVLGEVGIGKSRLVMEFASATLPRPILLRGRCRDARHGLTYWPLAEMAAAVAGPGPEDVPALTSRLTRVLGDEPGGPAYAEILAELIATSGAPPARQYVGDAVVALFARLARDRPLVVVIEDLHWASAPLLDLINELVDRLYRSPVLICAIARPELLDTRPAWGSWVNASMIRLAPLGGADSRQLVDHLLGEGGAETLRERLVVVSGGNPLFLEELVRTLVDDGLLAHDGTRWVSATDPMAVPLPPSISALLTTRLDRLDDRQRLVLTRASLIGESFSSAAVAALLPGQPAAEVEWQLAGLAELGHLNPEQGQEPAAPPGLQAVVTAVPDPVAEPGPEPGTGRFRFRHQMLRDVAYRRLPLRERAELHERYARWLQAAGAAPAPEEIVGFHLERACRYRVQVGSLDATAIDLAGEAAVLLGSAGRRAFGRRDMVAATELLGRAAGLFLGGGSQRAALLPDLAAALIETGRFDRAAEILTEAIATATRLSDTSALDQARRVRAVLHRFTRPAEVVPPLSPLSPVPPGAGTGEADASGMSDWTLLQHITPEALAGEETLLLDATPVSEGVRRCMQALTHAADNPTGQTRSLAVLAGLAAMQGHVEQARELLGSALTILRELGLAARAADLGFIIGFVELQAREPERAAQELRRSLAASEKMGHEYAASRLRALLARAYHDQGDHPEAYRLAAASERTAAGDDVAALTLARATRARAAASLGEITEAAQLAREAVWTAEGGDLANLHAMALFDLGVVLRTAGQHAEATAVLREALRRFDAKGNRAGVAMALRVLEPT